MEIQQALNELPDVKSRVSQEAEDARLEWQKAENDYDREEALFVAVLKTREPDLKTTEIKYYINKDDSLYQKRLDLRLLEASYRKKMVEVKDLEDKINSAKILARIRMSEMRTIDPSVGL